MNDNAWFRGKIQYLIPGCLLLIGGFLLLVFRLTHESVYWDEAYAWAMTNHSIPDIIRYTIDWENHPPLFYLATKLFRLFAGNSIFAIRLFSVLGALALMSLGLGPIRRACGLKTGLLFSSLTLLTPAMLSVARDGRMYTWSAFLVTGTIIYAYLAATGGKRSDWVKLGIMTLGAAYIHYFALVAVGFTNFLLFIWLFFKDRKHLPPFLITMGAVFIGYLPWLPAFIKQLTAVSQDFWIPPITPSVLWSTLLYPFGEKFDLTPKLFFFKPYAFGVVLALILWGIRQGAVQKSRVNSLNILSLAVYLSTFLTGIVLSCVLRPIWVSRYIATVLGLIILSLAIGVSFIRRKSTFLAAGVLILALTVPGVYQIYAQRFNGPLQEASAYLKPQLPADAVFVHFDWVTRDALYYYFPNHQHFVYMSTMQGTFSDPVFFNQSPAGPNLDTFLAYKRNIWFVTKLGAPGEKIAATVMENKKWTVKVPPKIFTLPYSEFGVTIYKIKPSFIRE